MFFVKKNDFFIRIFLILNYLIYFIVDSAIIFDFYCLYFKFDTKKCLLKILKYFCWKKLKNHYIYKKNIFTGNELIFFFLYYYKVLKKLRKNISLFVNFIEF